MQKWHYIAMVQLELPTARYDRWCVHDRLTHTSRIALYIICSLSSLHPSFPTSRKRAAFVTVIKAVADLSGGTPRPKFSQFHAVFFGKFVKIVCWFYSQINTKFLSFLSYFFSCWINLGLFYFSSILQHRNPNLQLQTAALCEILFKILYS